MVEYVNYNPETGFIIQSGSCPNTDCIPPGPEGSAWLFDVMVRDIENHRVDLDSKTIEAIE